MSETQNALTKDFRKSLERLHRLYVECGAEAFADRIKPSAAAWRDWRSQEEPAGMMPRLKVIRGTKIDDRDIYVIAFAFLLMFEEQLKAHDVEHDRIDGLWPQFQGSSNEETGNSDEEQVDKERDKYTGPGSFVPVGNAMSDLAGRVS
jgi:hypothetical protein